MSRHASGCGEEMLPYEHHWCTSVRAWHVRVVEAQLERSKQHGEQGDTVDKVVDR